VAAVLENPQGRRNCNLRIHQWLLQSASPPLSTGLEKPRRFRKESGLNEHLERHKNATGPVRKPRLPSVNVSSYVAADLAEYPEDKGMDRVRDAPHHPQIQGKIERWHQTMKNRVLLENYYLPGGLERQISAFVDHYSNNRYHESLDNLLPIDVYHGRGAKILKMTEEIKKQTIQKRR